MFEGFLKRNGDAPSAPVATESAPGERPIIGLALGGGAARGFAHIGVLRTLLANGIVPDVVAGTSIGAVVGACYATGHLDDFEAWARTLTPRGILSYLDISLTGAGFINGTRLASRLEEAIGNTSFDELPVKFAAIATEIGTGHEIWLTRGRIVEALRASYALPGIFTPVHLGGRWLVDGALVNPVPVSTVRAMGSRLVIAVNLNADLFGRGTTIASHGSDEHDDAEHAASAQRGSGMRRMFGPEKLVKRQLVGAPGRPGIPTVMVDAFNVMQDRITRARLAGDPPDVLVSPRLSSIGWFDFHRAEDAIAAGTLATERALDSILEAAHALAVPTPTAATTSAPPK